MLSFVEDDYTQSIMEGTGYWVIKLNNGQTVYQDDERDGVRPHSAWERLYHYCKENKLYIVDMYLRFRSHVEAIESNCDGYFFSKSIIGNPFTKNWNFYLVGTLKNGILIVDSWKLPELIKTESEMRSAKNCGVNLIAKPEI